MKKIKTKYKVLILLIFFLVIYIGKNVFDICAFSTEDQKCRADVAVILGAATYNGEVSPVYRERINHGITLYEEGYVDRLIVTGGTADQGEESDASAAKKYLLSRGIPEEAVLMEDQSSITQENLENSKAIMEEAFPYLGITTINESGEETKTEGTSVEQTEYTDYNENYEETYDNPDGSYIDEDYDPDLDDWAAGDTSE